MSTDSAITPGSTPPSGDHFTARGFAVHAPDLRGNGRSAGARGHIGAWSEYRDDSALSADLGASPRHPACRSSSSGIAWAGSSRSTTPCIIQSGSRGMIASAPPLGLRGCPGLRSCFLGQDRLPRLGPDVPLKTGMDLTGLARDPAIAAEVLADPLFHRKGIGAALDRGLGGGRAGAGGRGGLPCRCSCCTARRIGWSCRTGPASSPRGRLGAGCDARRVPGSIPCAIRGRGAGAGAGGRSRSGWTRGSGPLGRRGGGPKWRREPIRTAVAPS